MTWYQQYTGSSIGRVCHFLEVYGGLSLAENAIIGKDTVIKHGKQVATFTSIDKEVEGLDGWKFASKNVPVFDFAPGYAYLFERQEKLQRAAILESVIYEVMQEIVELENRCHNPTMVMKYLYKGMKNSSEYIKAKDDLDNLEIELIEQRKRLVDVKKHEFDYITLYNPDESLK